MAEGRRGCLEAENRHDLGSGRLSSGLGHELCFYLRLNFCMFINEEMACGATRPGTTRMNF